MKNIGSRLVLPIAALAMLGFGVFHMLNAKPILPNPPPPVPPARSPFGNSIAGAGVVEARTENIAVGSALDGVVLEVFVPVDEVGKEVEAGDLLFRVDDRQLRAQLGVHKANLTAAKTQLDKLEQMPRPEEVPPAEARVKAAEAKVDRLLDQYQRAQKLVATGAMTAESHTSIKQQYQEALHQRSQAMSELELLTAGAWEADKAVAQATIEQMEAQIAQTQTEIERALVRAPVSGRVLQVNVRPGEHVSATANEVLVVLGNIGSLRVRVDVDEADIPRFRPGANAGAFPRGDARQEIPLTFVRVEPLVIPKRSLTGDNTERVDTRVLQLIYEVAGSEQTLYVGQQLDVFVDVETAPAETNLARR